MIGPHWALTREELIRLVEDGLPLIPAEERALVEELLYRFNLLTEDDLK